MPNIQRHLGATIRLILRVNTNDTFSALSRIRTLTVVRHVLGVGPNTSRSPLLYPPEKRDPTNLLGDFSVMYSRCLMVGFPNIKMKCYNLV
ncbi:hypothetical protein AVEN_135929-1 [Araneus ventricosus]|uniref:Uncharacterized protein n=1 Tax=Araneus ventricosus TaxID=182803 RepID=A0A4Y2V4J3_ARAVE|nr:hypothetical protein AVEN_135929-1 [Araneus ventricosus]